MKKISEKIKELRTEIGYSQQQLANVINVQRYVISDWEQGRAEPDISNIILLAKFFEVSTDYLLGLED